MSGLELLGAGIGAAASILGGLQAAGLANEQRKTAEANAAIQRDNADRAIFKSQVEAQDQGFDNAALQGEQIAQQGASGLGGRSQQLLRRGTEILGKLGTERITQGGQIESAALRQDAANFDSEAKMHQMEGNNALINGFMGAASSLVGSARSIRSPGRVGASPATPRTRISAGLA